MPTDTRRTGGSRRLMSRIAGFTMLAGALAACSAVPGSGVSVNFYNVRGTTAQQIDSEIRRRGPNSGHALAVARIRMIPDVTYNQRGDGTCRYSRARVGVNAEVTLPRFIDRNRAEPGLRQAIDNLDEYARFHEAVHVAIAQEYAGRIGTQLRALPAAQSCAALDTRAAAISRQLLVEHDRVQRKFDEDEQRRLARLASS